MKLDIIIGFERKPEGLEAFLKEQGYDAVPNEEKDDVSETYVHREREWPEVIYSPQISEESELEEDICPDWRKSRYNVVSELGITYPVFYYDEAERLSEEIVKGFDGILYDTDLDEFFTKEDFMERK